MLNQEKIISSKPGSRVRYLICSQFLDKGTKSELFIEFNRYVMMGYQPEDIFILAPSVKSSKSPVRYQ